MLAQPDHKIEVLLEKINKLEISNKEERKNRIKAEEDLRNYRMITVPNLQKELEEKEKLCKYAFIEKIKLESEYLEKIKKVNII
jgi:hypothetical protein